MVKGERGVFFPSSELIQLHSNAESQYLSDAAALFTFQKGFLFWEEEAPGTARHQCDKLQQPEPEVQSSSVVEGILNTKL